MAVDGFVFLDLETTGLKPNTNTSHILELGIAHYSMDFDLVDRRKWLVFGDQAAFSLDHYQLDPFVAKMHASVSEGGSGLLKDLAGIRGDVVRFNLSEPQHVEDRAIEVLKSWGVDQTTPMCGSTVAAFDRPWLAAHMPSLNELFSHRSIDVSSDMEFIKAKYPKVWEIIDTSPLKIKRNGHRVWEDIEDSANLMHRIDRAVFSTVQEILDAFGKIEAGQVESFLDDDGKELLETEEL